MNNKENRRSINELAFSALLTLLFGSFLHLIKSLLTKKIVTLSSNIVLSAFLEIIILILSILVFWYLSRRFFKTKLGIYAKDLFYDFIDFFFLRSRKRRAFLKTVYSVEERSSQAYKKEMIHQIKASNRIHLHLLSAFTMFYDPREIFILEALQDLSYKEKGTKDIKLQLLNRNSPYFQERTKWFVKYMNEEGASYRCDYAEYIRKCEDIERQWESMFGKNSISFYQRKTIWRLHIFDDTFFVSTYVKDISSNMTPVYQLPRVGVSSLYTGFVDFFNSLYNKPAL